MQSLCKQLKDLVGEEKMRDSRQKASGFTLSLPKIISRPSTNTASSPLPGGRFVARDDAKLMEVDISEFKTCIEQFVAVDKEREGSAGYLASFLASLDLFSTWPWLEVVELSKCFKGIQIDKGVSLFAQGDRVDGLHVMHRGEAQIEFNDSPAERSYGASAGAGAGRESASSEGMSSNGANRGAYGYAVDITADSDGLPMTRISKKRLSKSIGLTVAFAQLARPKLNSKP